MAIDVDGYLRRLGITEPPGPPSVPALRALHAAHVERVPYETLDIQLGQVTSIDPYESVERIAGRGRGGYCYHLNGAFSLLLRRLGYDVVWHRAGVQGRGEAAPVKASRANHLGLTVHGLPTDECPSGDWLIDVGLGDGLHDPLPLREGVHRQGPLSFRLSRSEVEPGGWRLDHDPRGSFAGLDFGLDPATVDDFTDRHVYLSTSPESMFTRTCSVQRRDRGGVDSLTGCVLSRLGDDPRSAQVIERRSEWFAVLGKVFGLRLPDLGPAERDALWGRVQDAHRAWAETHLA